MFEQKLFGIYRLAIFLVESLSSIATIAIQDVMKLFLFVQQKYSWFFVEVGQ